MNLYGELGTFRRWGSTSPHLGRSSTRAAAAEGLKGDCQSGCSRPGVLFRSDHFPFAKAGVPGHLHRKREGLRGAARGLRQPEGKNEYTEKRYHQPSDEVLPTFKYGGAVQQLRVIVRTAVAVAMLGTSQPGIGIRVPSGRRGAGEERQNNFYRHSPPFPSTYYLYRRLTLPTVPRERFWTSLPSTGFRLPGCWRTPGRRSDIAPTGSSPPKGTPLPKSSRAAQLAILDSKAALAVVKKQKDNGIWGGNLLGLASSAAQGIKDVGTIPQYRRLLQLEWPRTQPPFQACRPGTLPTSLPGRRPIPAIRVPEDGKGRP